MSITFPTAEAEPGLRVLDAITDPDIDKQLGFSLLDSNPDFSDETTIQILDEELNDKRPAVDRELKPALDTAREQYAETFGSGPALRASEARWVDTYLTETGAEQTGNSIFEYIASEGPTQILWCYPRQPRAVCSRQNPYSPFGGGA